jgi:hypothetical protein
MGGRGERDREEAHQTKNTDDKAAGAPDSAQQVTQPTTKLLAPNRCEDSQRQSCYAVIHYDLTTHTPQSTRHIALLRCGLYAFRG